MCCNHRQQAIWDDLHFKRFFVRRKSWVLCESDIKFNFVAAVFAAVRPLQRKGPCRLIEGHQTVCRGRLAVKRLNSGELNSSRATEGVSVAEGRVVNADLVLNCADRVSHWRLLNWGSQKVCWCSVEELRIVALRVDDNIERQQFLHHWVKLGVVL